MATVTIELPSMLSQGVGVPASIAVEAPSLEAALRRLVEEHPALDVHLFDETGGFRQHVLCFHNRTNTRWLPSVDVALAAGDTITILQAVSGG
jgi:molybdopterin converting factor small subunit